MARSAATARSDRHVFARPELPEGDCPDTRGITGAGPCWVGARSPEIRHEHVSVRADYHGRHGSNPIVGAGGNPDGPNDPHVAKAGAGSGTRERRMRSSASRWRFAKPDPR
jgi:hypothetical protein